MKITPYKDCISYLANNLLLNYKNGGNEYLYDQSTTEQADLLQFIYKSKCRAEIGNDIRTEFNRIRYNK